MFATIESLCKAQNINITKMCADLNISRSTLTELKTGRTKELSSQNLVKIAKYFDVSIDFLLASSFLNNDAPVVELAAYHEVDDWTEEERKEIELFKAFLRSKRTKQ